MAPEADLFEERITFAGRAAGFYAYRLAQQKSMEFLAAKPELAEWLGQTAVDHDMRVARWN